MKELENMNTNELLKLKNDVDHRLWRMGFDNKHSIEKSLVDISEALQSLDKTFRRIEAREKGIQISGRYSWGNSEKTQYDREKEEDL